MKATMKEFATEDQANYYSGITCVMVNGKRSYELKGKFLDDLRDNAFSGTNGEDAIRIDDQNGVIDDGFSDLEGANNDDEQEIGEIFRIETNLFNYETPLCTKFNKFNYLLKVDPELFTRDIERTKTYEDYENELNDELEDPWSKDGVPYEICDHICQLFRFKNGETKWPTCNSNEDGFCDGGELPNCNTSFNSDEEHENDEEGYQFFNDVMETRMGIEQFTHPLRPTPLPESPDLEISLMSSSSFGGERKDGKKGKEKGKKREKTVDVVFDGAFGGVRDEEVVVGEGVVVISSSLDMLTNSCLGGIMVSLIFLEGLDEEALVEFMVEWCEKDEDDDRREFMI
ncbi:hypothetical protein Tco_0077996 [Tanacetum coccineum]